MNKIIRSVIVVMVCLYLCFTINQLNAQAIVNVKDFGALGNGNNDDAGAIEKAILQAAKQNKVLFFPAGKYVIKEQVHLQGKLIGVSGQSTFLIENGFVFSEKINGRNYSVFLNRNFKGKKDIYADDIDIENLNFEFNASLLPSTVNLLGLADVKKGLLYNCNFTISNGCQACITGIDLWSAVSHFKIVDCTINNLNEERAGGCLWVRNISTEGNNNLNDTYDITIDSCSFTSASKDEILAVYGVRGLTRNVVINNSYFNALPSSEIHTVLLSVFPLNDGSYWGSFAGVKNVVVKNCRFTDQYFSAHILRIGQESDKNQLCDSIIISNNSFFAAKKRNEISFIARNIKCTGDNVQFIQNKLSTEKSSVPIFYAIAGFDLVANNYITGNFKNIIVGSKNVYGNILENVQGKAFDKPEMIKNNIIKN